MKTRKKIDHGPAQSFSLEQLLKEHLQPAVCAALYAVVEKEVAAMCGPPQHPDPDADCRRAGSVMARVNLPGCPQNLKRPRVRKSCEGGSVEVALSTWQAAKDPAQWQETTMRAALWGASMRGVSQLMGSLPRGMSRSAVSRRWQQYAAKLVEEMQQSDLSEFDLLTLMLDAVMLAKGIVVTVALGIDTAGRKRILGFRVGSSENREVCQDLLSRLKARGLKAPVHRDLLAVVDGSDALRSALLAHCPTALVQRCLVHKERNVRHYLSQRHWAELARLFDRLRKAQGGAQAEVRARAIRTFLEERNAQARSSFEEAGDDLLRVFHLEVPGQSASHAALDQLHRERVPEPASPSGAGLSLAREHRPGRPMDGQWPDARRARPPAHQRSRGYRQTGSRAAAARLPGSMKADRSLRRFAPASPLRGVPSGPACTQRRNDRAP